MLNQYSLVWILFLIYNYKACNFKKFEKSDFRDIPCLHSGNQSQEKERYFTI